MIHGSLKQIIQFYSSFICTYILYFILDEYIIAGLQRE